MGLSGPIIFLVRIQTHHGMELYLQAAASSPRIQDRAAINDIQQIDGLAHAAAHHESSPNQKACEENITSMVTF